MPQEGAMGRCHGMCHRMAAQLWGEEGDLLSEVPVISRVVWMGVSSCSGVCIPLISSEGN